MISKKRNSRYPLLQVLGLLFLGIAGTGCPSSSSKSSSASGKEAESFKEEKVDSNQKSSESTSAIRFVDRCQEAGIDHRYDDGRSGNVYSIVESAGGGLAVIDFDRDGRLDLLYPGGGKIDAKERTTSGLPGALYRSLDAWRFESCGGEAGIDMSEHYHHGVAVADYDNDGLDDVLVTGLTGQQLFHNQGDGTFQKRSSTGIQGAYAAVSAAWGDIENDGDLDLLVVTYTDWTFEKNPTCTSREGIRDLCGPRDFGGSDDHFYINQGDGTFRDASNEIGLLRGGRGLGALAADLDGDRRVEFFVSNDEEVNFLYQNRGDGKLVERGVKSGAALDDAGSPDGNMGIALGDYNLDGKFDLFITHYETETCGLYKNVGRLNFQHSSRIANITCMGNLFVGWGTAFADLDLDGDEDLALVNGHVLRTTGMAPLDQTGVVLENQVGKSFHDISKSSGPYFQIPKSARGLITADFDGDGRVDLATSNVLQPHGLLQNQTETNGSWLRLRLRGTESNRNAIGAVAIVEHNGKVWTRQIIGGGSYASTSDGVIHLGFGNLANVDRVTIRWPITPNSPNGKDTILDHPVLNSEHLIIEP